MKQINTVICGGDTRMLSVAALFSKIGKCYLWRSGFGEKSGIQRTDNLREASLDAYVILPIPSFDKEGRLNGAGHICAEEFFRLLPCSSVIFGAKLSPIRLREAKEYGHCFYDYGEREDFNILNAVPTAEAAMLITMENSLKTVDSSEYVIVGYGRIGKALANRLRKMGGRVTVAARSDGALAAAVCDGHKAMNISALLKAPVPCDVCYNTVPAPLFDEDCVRKWHCPLFVELASMPGGFLQSARQYLEERYVSALSLPGRYFPVTAGEIIYRTVVSMIASEVTR